MRSVLPGWVRDFVGIEDMVQGFPLIVFGIAMYLLYSGISLTRHHAVVAKARQWTPEEKQDPLFSAPWTLIYRGPIGTATTIILYTGVFVVAWIFVREGGDILIEWLDAGNTPAVSESMYQPTRNGMFVFLLGGFGYVLWCILKSCLQRER
jgi:hypothetical protein